MTRILVPYLVPFLTSFGKHSLASLARMPKVPAYTRGFGLKKKMVLNGYTLTSINIHHTPIKLFQEYGYPTILTWTPLTAPKSSTPIAFLAALSKRLSGTRVIYTTYGNAYRCSFGSLVISGEREGVITITSHGICNKIKKPRA